MTHEIRMPALSPTMEDGKLARWLVAEGDEITAGAVIAEVEADKATMEVEAETGGRIAKLLVAEGTEGIAVDTPIALMGGNGDGAGDGRARDGSSLNPGGALGADGHHDVAQVATIASQAPDTGRAERTPADVGPTAARVRRQTMREALRDGLAEEMRRDPDVFLVGEEVGLHGGAYKVSQGLIEEFGARRVMDAPVTPQGIAGLAAGAAFAGLKPVVEFMTWTFAMQALDQIINSAAKTRYRSGGRLTCPIVFRGPNGAAPGAGAQHAQCHTAWYAHVPGLKVVAPSTAAQAKGLLKAAIRDPDPVVILENELLYSAVGDVPDDADWAMPIGLAEIAEPGTHVTIVAYGRAVVHASAAAERLKDDGISAEVIDLVSLRPIDWDTIVASVRKTNRLVTVEEAWPAGSIGSEICAGVVARAFDHLDAPPTKVTGADVPMPYAANLERLALPTPDDVVRAVKAVCYVS